MLNNINFSQKKIIIILAVIFFLIIIVFFYNKSNFSNEIDYDGNILVQNTLNETNSLATKEEEALDIVIVHITGAVKKPGVVKLPEGSRIEDAIISAGGLTEDADISNVNLAYILEDGIKIIIPNIDHNLDIEDIIVEDNEPSAISNQISKKIEVNINKAKEEELQKLPGIGPSLATKIIEYRNENGKFYNIEDIKNVSRSWRE